MKRLLSIGIILLFIGLSVSSTTGYNKENSFQPLSSGNTLYVGGSGPGNYTRIKDAIDDASDGDTVFVYNGTYYENVVVDKSINLIGENRDTTIIWNILNTSGGTVLIISDNVNICGFGITNSSCSRPGIEMISSKNSIIYNCSLYNNYGCISIQNSMNISIIQCNIFDSKQSGISFHNVINSKIRKSNVYNNYHGVLIGESRDNIIDSCYFLNNTIGIYLQYNTQNHTIKKCKIFNNNRDGIRLGGAYNIVTRNNIATNKRNGIFLYGWSSNNTNIIARNNISLNNENGIYLNQNSFNNIIYHNNFINNTNMSRDEGNNTWDNGYPSGGNYWDDYTGNDSDGDGIGDTPYPIPGGDNEDRYPLMKPYGNGGENWTFFITSGPICPLLNIAEINLIDGNDSQIQKIEKILNNRILQFIIPPRWGFINVTELDFTITYNKEIPKIPFWVNFVYATMLQENENDTFIEQPHTVTVKGLNGHFVISRGQPLRFRPPYFVFAGDTYEEITIELIERG